jgi:PKD repeat protein
LQSFNIKLVVQDTVHFCSDSATKTVEVNEKPLATFDAPNGCIGTAVPFSNGSVPPAGQTMTYSWTFNPGDPGAVSTQINPNWTYNAPGNYPVTLTTTTNKGCSDVAYDTVSVNNAPEAGFTSAEVTCSTYVFTPTTLGLQGYLWDFGDGSGGNRDQSPQENTYQSKGKHYVRLTVTDENGCTNTKLDSVETTCTIGMDEAFAAKFNLSVYPNPFEDVANISYNLNEKQNVSITVYDLLGKVVSETTYNNQNAGSHTVKLDEAKFSGHSAIYMVRIQIGEDVTTKQLLHQR